MGIVDDLITATNVSSISSQLVPSQFWYIFLIIAPGYIIGLLIFYWRYNTSDSWFEKSSFDKTIISVIFGGLLIVLISLTLRIYYLIKGIKVDIKINPEELSIFVTQL